MQPGLRGWETLPSRAHTIRKLEILCAPEVTPGPKIDSYIHTF